MQNNLFHAKHTNIIVSFPLWDHDLHNIWTTATITSRTATSTTTIPLHFLGKRDVSLKCQSQAGRSSIPGFRDGSKLDKHVLDFPCFWWDDWFYDLMIGHWLRMWKRAIAPTLLGISRVLFANDDKSYMHLISMYIMPSTKPLPQDQYHWLG